jgi:hypothetical protein
MKKYTVEISERDIQILMAACATRAEVLFEDAFNAGEEGKDDLKSRLLAVREDVLGMRQRLSWVSHGRGLIEEPGQPAA